MSGRRGLLPLKAAKGSKANWQRVGGEEVGKGCSPDATGCELALAYRIRKRIASKINSNFRTSAIFHFSDTSGVWVIESMSVEDQGAYRCCAQSQCEDLAVISEFALTRMLFKVVGTAEVTNFVCLNFRWLVRWLSHG